jgi:Domain of unknown function (DUF1876)
MESLNESKVWTVTVDIEETEDETQAKAMLDAAGRNLGGWGRARRNPTDPSVPRVGEELAVARALSDLAHRLLDEAAHEIERFEGKDVHVHP